MTEQEKREAIRQFINKWNGRGKEDEDDRSFWIDFLQALGVEHVTDRIGFQKKVTVSDGHKKRIDAYIPETNVLAELRRMKKIMERVNAVREFRLNSPKIATQKSADSPTTFQEIRQPDTDYMIVPWVSSENRRYIPLGFMNKDIIVNDSVQIIPDATLYEFGILISNVHMAWMRVVCGRLKDARALYPDSSLADLYDPLTMPSELRKAHTENDKAVMKAYGFDIKMSEADCVTELMKMYQSLVEQK